MVIVLMGVSGAGKTTVGRMLARALGWEFVDADDLHSSANKSKMAAGVPLTDADRVPWLAAIRELIARHPATGTNLVLACSALKQIYRDQIAAGGDGVQIVYLKGNRELIRSRLATRANLTS